MGQWIVCYDRQRGNEICKQGVRFVDSYAARMIRNSNLAAALMVVLVFFLSANWNISQGFEVFKVCCAPRVMWSRKLLLIFPGGEGRDGKERRKVGRRCKRLWQGATQTLLGNTTERGEQVLLHRHKITTTFPLLFISTSNRGCKAETLHQQSSAF